MIIIMINMTFKYRKLHDDVTYSALFLSFSFKLNDIIYVSISIIIDMMEYKMNAESRLTY